MSNSFRFLIHQQAYAQSMECFEQFPLTIEKRLVKEVATLPDSLASTSPPVQVKAVCRIALYFQQLDRL